MIMRLGYGILLGTVSLIGCDQQTSVAPPPPVEDVEPVMQEAYRYRSDYIRYSIMLPVADQHVSLESMLNGNQRAHDIIKKNYENGLWTFGLGPGGEHGTDGYMYADEANIIIRWSPKKKYC